MALNDPRSRTINQEDGFTLMELLVVMLIIGILSAIAVPAFLNQRKQSADEGTKSTLASLASKAQMIAPRIGDTEDLTMEAIMAMELGPLKVGTIVGVAGNPEGGFCLTAYNPSSGTYTESQPMIWDSKLSQAVIYNAEDLGGGACDLVVRNSAIQPAFEVKKINGTPTLEAIEVTTTLSNACHGVTPYQYDPEFRATTTTGEHVSLNGFIKLSDDCRQLSYSLRVVDTPAESVHAINLNMMNRNQGGWSDGPDTQITFTGKAVSKGTIETHWKKSSNWNGLFIESTIIQDSRIGRDIIWEPQQ